MKTRVIAAIALILILTALIVTGCSMSGSRLGAENEQLKKDIMAMEQNIQQLKAALPQIHQLKKENSELEKEIASTKKEISSLRATLKKAGVTDTKPVKK